MYETILSAGFPSDAIAGEEFNRGGGQIDTPLLIRAWREACAAVVAGKWTDATVKVCLKTLCVNEVTIKALLDQCKQHVLWQDIGDDPENYDSATNTGNGEMGYREPHAWFLARYREILLYLTRTFSSCSTTLYLDFPGIVVCPFLYPIFPALYLDPLYLIVYYTWTFPPIVSLPPDRNWRSFTLSRKQPFTVTIADSALSELVGVTIPF
jgi:hypothetical protein